MPIGVLSAVAAYTIWGFFPVYFKAIDRVGAIEILCHRVVWSLPFGFALILARKQVAQTLDAILDWQRLKWLLLASIMIAVNWGLYVWAIQVDRILEASLGYYINPLMYVVAGVVFYKESLSRLQLLAIALATLGVAVLTIASGSVPWISMILAVTFTLYGVIRKRVDVAAMPGLFVEVCLLFLPAIAYLGWLIASDRSEFGKGQTDIDLLLVAAGPLTIIPLLFFTVAARKLRLSTLGFLQFIGPTLQFGCALYYGEVFSRAHAVCFALIWTAVAVFVWSLRPKVPRLAETQ